MDPVPQSDPVIAHGGELPRVLEDLAVQGRWVESVSVGGTNSEWCITLAKPVLSQPELTTLHERVV